jgi:hypothetical protein
MRDLVHVHYREVVGDTESVSYEPSEIDSSLSQGLYTSLDSLAAVGASSFMRMVELNPSLSVFGQRINMTEALMSVGITGLAWGLDRIWGSMKAIHQHIESSRAANAAGLAPPASKSLSVQFNPEGLA